MDKEAKEAKEAPEQHELGCCIEQAALHNITKTSIRAQRGLISQLYTNGLHQALKSSLTQSTD